MYSINLVLSPEQLALIVTALQDTVKRCGDPDPTGHRECYQRVLDSLPSHVVLAAMLQEEIELLSSPGEPPAPPA